jgi:putative ABC transport system substrate-binding protein
MVEGRFTLIVAFAVGIVFSPIDVDAQQREKIPRVGYLSNSSSESAADSAFMQGLRDLGRVDGRTIVIEARYAGARSEQLPVMARDLVSRGVDVLAVWSPRAVAAVMEATSTIPIVGLSMGNLVTAGVVPSVGRPVANVTGVADLQKELQAKRVELLKQTFPGIRRIAVLSNPLQGPSILEYVSALNVAARSLGVQLEVLNVSAQEELDGAFAEINRRRADGLVVLPDGMFWAVRADIVRLAGKARVPAIYWERAYAEVGGLMSYAASLSDIARRGAALVDKILNGAKPADLPVEQPTRFELIINLKTAKALGITIPQAIVLRADEVIR